MLGQICHIHIYSTVFSPLFVTLLTCQERFTTGTNSDINVIGEASFFLIEFKDKISILYCRTIQKPVIVEEEDMGPT